MAFEHLTKIFNLFLFFVEDVGGSCKCTCGNSLMSEYVIIEYALLIRACKIC